jgi:uncharacterized protein YqiB (DUF1249 family)
MDKFVHVKPPSKVFNIVPDPPTAYPVFSSVKQVETKSFPCGKGFCHAHWANENAERNMKRNKMLNFFISNWVLYCKTKTGNKGIYVYYFVICMILHLSVNQL